MGVLPAAVVALDLHYGHVTSLLNLLEPRMELVVLLLVLAAAVVPLAADLKENDEVNTWQQARFDTIDVRR